MKILYDGIGADNSREHTKEQFLNIMNKEFTHKNWRLELKIIPRELHHQCNFKDWILPMILYFLH